jgi:glycosyltransferase involved in cell wall biosynthesis
LKVLEISASYKPAYIYGGPIMSVSMLAEELVKAGVMVDVFTTTANGNTELELEARKPVIVDSVNVTYFARITKDHTQFSPTLLLHLWKKARDYDVIHIHAWWNLVSVLGCLVATLKKVPVVVSPRGTLSNYSFSNKNNGIKALIHQLVTRPLLKMCFIHTTSANEYRSVKKIIQAKKFYNITNFIRFDTHKNYTKPNQEKILKIIFFSRIEEKKGLNILLNALKDIALPYRLTVAGDGDATYVNSLKNLAQKNNIDAFVDWVGFQGEHKFELLHQHDLFVLPSYDENFGNVIIESLSVGTAVLIGRNVGLADYVVENQMGWLCETNVSSLSEAIQAISTQQDELSLIRKEAPDKIMKDFDANNLVKKYIDLYNKIKSDE